MTSDQPALRIRGLAKRYGDFRLGPLDLELEPGRVLAFVGPNGAGKTTTLHLVMGLVQGSSGTVEVAGRANDPRRPDWKQDVGFVGEFQGFFREWSVARNLEVIGRFYHRWDPARAEALARRFDLPLHKPAAALSRGNRTKLALVAALAHSPRLLLLDEPTQGLDPVVRAEVLDALWELMEDGEHSILYSTHVLSDVSRLADELAFLRDGRLVQRTRTDVLTDSWRRISFRFDRQDVHLQGLDGAHSLRRRGTEYQVISSDHAATTGHLEGLGATGVQTSRMTIDDITVEILRRPQPASSEPSTPQPPQRHGAETSKRQSA